MPRMTFFAASLAVAVGILDPGAKVPTPSSAGQVEANHAAEHRSPGKPGAQVRLTGPGRYVLPLGEVGKLNLALQAVPDQGVLTVEVKLGEGLTLVSGQTRRQVDLAATRELLLPLQVTASTAGQHFVHVFTWIEDASGASASRAMAVPVQAGLTSEQHQHKSAAPTEAAPEWIKLPVSETIR